MNKLSKLVCIILLSLFSITVIAENNDIVNEVQSKIQVNETVKLQDVADLSPININNADETTLTLLTGVGITRAKAIIAYRQSQGKFKTLEELLKVKGIGEQFLEKNKTRLTI